LTGSILLSWVMRSKYFFPVPSISIRPEMLMGGPMAKSSSSSSPANYGLNVGPMAVSWFLRFVYGRVENWTGKALSRAYQTQRRAARKQESDEDKIARKAARKQEKLEAHVAERVSYAPHPPSTLPMEWMHAIAGDIHVPPSPFQDDSGNAFGLFPLSSSSAHQEFLEQLEQPNSLLDDLD
jgi:hypothetical protein